MNWIWPCFGATLVQHAWMSMDTSMLIQVPGLIINGLHNESDHWHVHLTSTLKSSQCPTCHQASLSIHSHYRSTDLPIAEKPVLLELSVRRFCCRTQTCSQRIFCERLSDPIVHARHTKRPGNTLSSLTVELGGRAAARLGSRLKLLGGRTSVLNALKSMPLPVVNKPHIIGVHDFAFKHGHTKVPYRVPVHGTVIVDLETHKPIDLLPDRQGSTLTSWLSRSCQGCAQQIEILDRVKLMMNTIKT
jgi:transposase